MRTPYITLLLAALTIAGCGNKADPQTLMAEARNLEKSGNLNGALIQLKNAVQAKSDDKDVRLQLGRLYLTLEDYASAEKEFKRARQNGADSAITDSLIAEALFGERDFRRLIDELPLPEKSSASYPDILARKAIALISLDRKIDAAKLLEQAKENQLSGPLISLASATMETSNNNTSEAFTTLEEGLKVDPNQIDLLIFKAGLLQTIGKTAEANAVYETILKINPHQQAARLALIQAAINEKKLVDARKSVDALLKLAPQNLSARYMVALIDFKESKPTEARDHLAPVLKASPDYMPALLLSGAVEYVLGNLESSQNQLLKVLQANPNNAYARRMVAAAKLRQGQVNDAHDIIAPLKPETSSDASTLVVAGEIALAQKKYAQAEDFFNKAARINPKSAAIRTELGLARLGQGDTQGLGDLESASLEGLEGQRAAALLILAYLKKGDFDNALKSITEQEKQHASNPVLAYFKGKAYAGRNDEANARKYYELALNRDGKYFPAAYELARLDIKAGQLKAAERRFDRVLAADPKNISAMLAHAQLALKSGHEDEYLGWLNKAAQSNTKALQPRAQIALYYLSKKDYQKALAAAREASVAQPNNTEAIALLGQTQLAAGEANNAQSTFGKLVELKPDSAAALFQLGRAQYAANKPDAAQSSFQKALRIDPNFGEAQISLAALYSKTGRFDEGIKIARQIQGTQKSNAIGYALEGDIQMAAKQPSLALAAYNKAISLQSNGKLLIKQYATLVSLGRIAEAEALLSGWLAKHPDDLEVRAHYAEALLARNQYKLAADQYHKLNSDSPNNVMILNNLAYALAQLQDKQAVQAAQQALKLAPEAPSTLDTMGWALAQTGSPDKALGFFQNALSKKPDDGDIQYHYAASLAMSGDKARAQRELAQLLSTGISFPLEKEARLLLNSLQGKTY